MGWFSKKPKKPKKLSTKEFKALPKKEQRAHKKAEKDFVEQAKRALERHKTDTPGKHYHNDNGKQELKGSGNPYYSLYTHCTCGHLMAVDKVHKDDV